MEYLVMDRASASEANDLAEVRKLIDGMNALVNSQQLQQQQLQQQQQQLQQSEYPLAAQDAAAALMASFTAATQQHNIKNEVSTPIPSSNTSPSPKLSHPSSTITKTPNNTTTLLPNTNEPSTPTINPKDTNINSSQQAESQVYSNPPPPQAGAIIEVTHLTYNRVLYFQLTQDATIEPMVAWLRLSFGDGAISGMVLQYKGFDGLWKCLLNRDDSLRRILKQGMTRNVMLQMRVPREQDLLSSGYTDRRLLALTKSESL